MRAGRVRAGHRDDVAAGRRGDDPAYRQAGARVKGGCLVDGRGDVAGELGDGGIRRAGLVENVDAVDRRGQGVPGGDGAAHCRGRAVGEQRHRVGRDVGRAAAGLLPRKNRADSPCRSIAVRSVTAGAVASGVGVQDRGVEQQAGGEARVAAGGRGDRGEGLFLLPLGLQHRQEARQAGRSA